MVKTRKKKEPPPPPPPRETPEEFEERQKLYAWLDAEIAAGRVQMPTVEPMPEEWFDRIRAEKPSRITANTWAEHDGVGELERQGVFKISGWAVGKHNGQTIYSICYPQPKQADLI